MVRIVAGRRRRRKGRSTVTTDAMRLELADTGGGANSMNVTATVLELLAQADSSLDSDRDAVRVFITRATELITAEQVDRSAVRQPTRVARGGLLRWQMNRLKAYIDANLGSAIAASDLTAVVNLSASHFFRSFKESFGEAPFAYIARKRIERAQDMMRTTGEPLSQIALACGLCDQSHFTRTFRRIVGMNPNAWRREHAAPEAMAQSRVRN